MMQIEEIVHSWEKVESEEIVHMWKPSAVPVPDVSFPMQTLT